MRVSSLVVISSVGLLALVVCAYFLARRHGVSVELTRNAAANTRAREREAKELLQQLAADPKLTVGSQTVSGAKSGKRPLVLAAVSRHVLPLLISSTGPGGSGAHPLLERLGNVDVESVSYQKEEIPALISELTAVQSEHPTSPLSGDLALLIDCLRKGGDKESEVIFY